MKFASNDSNKRLKFDTAKTPNKVKFSTNTGTGKRVISVRNTKMDKPVKMSSPKGMNIGSPKSDHGVNFSKRTPAKSKVAMSSPRSLQIKGGKAIG